MEKLGRGTMKIKICQLKLNSKHMLHAGDNKEYDSSVVLKKWEIKERKYTSILKRLKTHFLRGNTW